MLPAITGPPDYIYVQMIRVKEKIVPWGAPVEPQLIEDIINSVG